MLSILDIAVAFPAGECCIEDIAPELGLKPLEVKMFTRFFGFQRIPFDPEKTLLDLVEPTLSTLVDRHPTLPKRLRLLAHCRTLPAVCPFDTSMVAELGERYGSRLAETVGVTMNHCATGVATLSLMDAVLPGDSLGVVLIGEKAFHRSVQLIQNTTVMGEAAVAVLVGRGEGWLHCIDLRSSYDGSHSVNAGHPSGAPVTSVGPPYYELVVNHIRRALEESRLEIGQIRRIFPHNVNTPSWLQIARMLSISPDLVHTQNVSRHGHCFGADPFVNLVDALDSGLLQAGDCVLLLSAGLGVTVSTALVRVPARAGGSIDSETGRTDGC